MKQAVMIVLKRNDKFLLGKRSSWKPKAPGFWCPISGHIENDETEEAAVTREAREELGVEVKAIQKIAMIPTHDNSVLLHWWIAELIDGEPSLNNDENSEIRWFSKSELKSLNPVFQEDIEILLNF